MKIMTLRVMPGAEPLEIDGSDTGVLMLHGFTGSPYEFKYLVEGLQKSGYTLSVPLLCGHGTQEEDLLKCQWYDWFEDAKQALFRLRKKCRKIVVIGLSTGATLALHLAAHYQLEGVVALSPALFLKEKFLPLLPILSPFIKYRKKDGGPDISDKEERNKAVTYHKTPIKAAQQVLELYKHVTMDLPDVYVPVLIAHSIQDHVVDFRSSEYIYEKVSSTEKHFLKLEKSYHVMTLDVEREVLFREINAFLKVRFNK